MTISTTASRISYNGNGATVAFSFPYRFLANGDLVVVLRSATGSESILLLGTHYTLSGAGSDAGGTVTMTTAPAVGERLVIYRNVAITQETDYISGDPFPAETHEQALDRLTMIDQQQQDSLDRTLRFPVSDTVSPDLPTQAVRANKLLAFDALGNPTTAVPVTDSSTDVRLDLAGSGGSAMVGANDYQTQADVNAERVSVLQFGAVMDGVTDDTAAMLAGMVATASAGKALYIPSGRLVYTAGAQAIDNVCIVGEKMPSANSTSTALESGSILVGTLKITGKNPTISNLGVDHGSDAFPASPENALSLSYAPGPLAGANRGGMARLSNVIGLCANSTDPYHAVLVEGYADCFVDRCIGIKSFFPFAFKVQRADISNIISRLSGSDGVIFKADTQYGDCDYVNAQNIVVEGSAGVTSNCVRVMSFDAQIERINISNITGTGAARGLYVDVNGSTGIAVNELNIDNYSFSAVTTGMLFSAGAGSIYSANVGKGSCVGVGGRVIDTSGSVQALRINGLYGSLSASSPNVADAINIGSSVASYSADNVDLVVNYGTTSLAGMALANSYANNWIGRGKFNLSGVGIPRDGFSDVTVTGTSQTLTPVYDGRNKESFIRVVPSAGATVSTLAREMTSGVRFPYGYRLTIVNDSLNSLVINNSPGGYITNRGGTNLTLASNEAVSYVFMSAVWHMVT